MFLHFLAKWNTQSHLTVTNFLLYFIFFHLFFFLNLILICIVSLHFSRWRTCTSLYSIVLKNRRENLSVNVSLAARNSIAKAHTDCRNLSSDYLKEARKHPGYHSAKEWRTETEWQRRVLTKEAASRWCGAEKEALGCRRKLKNPGKKDAGGRADYYGVFNLTFSSF